MQARDEGVRADAAARSARPRIIYWRVVPRRPFVNRIMSEPEVWLRGPLPDVAPLLQPVAHSLLQCRAELRDTLPSLERAHVWARPGGAASVGYHARHAIGSLDRLLTYARGEQLSPAQLDALKAEG